MKITLKQFEKIDGALSAFCANERQVDNGAGPRLGVRAENRILDEIIDIVDYERASEILSLAEWPATVVSQALTGTIQVVDGEAV